MRTEPDIDRRALIRLIRDRYRLDVGGLEFVPHGIDSWSYVAIGADAGRWFVKLSRPRGAGTPDLGWDLPLLAALAEHGRVPVARPIADRDGGFVSAFDAHQVRVLEYLEGRTLTDETAWPDPLYAKVADIVGAAHAGTGQVRDLVTRTERFELPFVPSFVTLVGEIVDGVVVPTGDGRAVAELRDLVVPRADELLAAVARLQALRDHARARGGETVLCHTDIWGSNLILSSDGTLHLVDWDGALIGPPEADLFMFAGTGFFPAERFDWFLERYEAAFRPVQPDPDVLGFYFYRRNLEDLADFVDAAATGRTDAMALTDSLALVGELLDEQARLEDRIEVLREVIGHRPRP